MRDAARLLIFEFLVRPLASPKQILDFDCRLNLHAVLAL